jgi:hypothetical protein
MQLLLLRVGGLGGKHSKEDVHGNYKHRSTSFIGALLQQHSAVDKNDEGFVQEASQFQDPEPQEEGRVNAAICNYA